MSTRLFEGFCAFRKRMENTHCLEVLHECGYRWIASFEWEAPSSSEQIEYLLKSIDVPVPDAYRFFLKHSNGATLFKDSRFGQWGFVLYSAEDLISKRTIWREKMGLPSEFLVFCECLGGADLLILDTTRPTPDSLDCAVLYLEEAVPISECRLISRSFHEWLDHLIVAQGAKFWCWK